jgi:hypothetical protein
MTRGTSFIIALVMDIFFSHQRVTFFYKAGYIREYQKSLTKVEKTLSDKI